MVILCHCGNFPTNIYCEHVYKLLSNGWLKIKGNPCQLSKQSLVLLHPSKFVTKRYHGWLKLEWQIAHSCDNNCNILNLHCPMFFFKRQINDTTTYTISNWHWARQVESVTLNTIFWHSFGHGPLRLPKVVHDAPFISLSKMGTSFGLHTQEVAFRAFALQILYSIICVLRQAHAWGGGWGLSQTSSQSHWVSNIRLWS